VTLLETPALPSLQQRLNTHEPLTLREDRALLDDAWSHEALEGFFRALERTGGLEAVG